MTFLALLTKEMRTRLRRERVIWLMVVYVLILGLIGVVVVNNAGTAFNNNPSNIGPTLYYLLAIMQLLLIIFATPAFTASAINGEKERQTFDLLMCSQLTGFTLVMGKLIAGLSTVLLLIASSVPLFSLLLFFGGVSPLQMLKLLLVYIITAILVGTFGMFCSACFRQPVLSTVVAYLASLLWFASPLAILFFWRLLANQYPSSSQYAYIFIWWPFATVDSVANGTLLGPKPVVPQWILYSILSVLISCLFLVLSVYTAKPNAARSGIRNRKSSPTASEASVSA